MFSKAVVLAARTVDGMILQSDLHVGWDKVSK